MAKEYRAVNLIRVGRAPEEDVEFKPGEAVTGLTKEQMIELWNAGVLTEYDTEADQAMVEKDAIIADLQAKLDAAMADKAAAEAAAAAAAPPAEAPAESPTAEPAEPASDASAGTTDPAAPAV